MLDFSYNLFSTFLQDMFGKTLMELDTLCRFALTVRKNYRPVSYHNWMHGFHVAHALWVMVANSGNVFTKVEKMALVVAGVCHDLDHRGYNNAFFQVPSD
jgi:cAMP and cAMP-inhibited cGMP 3',5'-cyclic phosphodiesterase 10